MFNIAFVKREGLMKYMAFILVIFFSASAFAGDLGFGF